MNIPLSRPVGEKDLKRAITGIVAAGLALGMMAPAAFAATSSSYQLSAAGGKTISVDGFALYTGVQAATPARDGRRGTQGELGPK